MLCCTGIKPGAILSSSGGHVVTRGTDLIDALRVDCASVVTHCYGCAIAVDSVVESESLEEAASEVRVPSPGRGLTVFRHEEGEKFLLSHHFIKH